MGDFLPYGGARLAAYGIDSSNSARTQLPAVGTANTHGAWVELVAATEFPASNITVDLFANAVSDHLVDIAIGPALGETVILPSLISTGIYEITTYRFPFELAAGTRIAARHQCSSAANPIRVGVNLTSDNFSGDSTIQRITAYGDNAADSGGVVVDPGAVINTPGQWTEIVAATANPIKTLSVGVGARANTAMAVAKFVLDLAIGPALGEEIITPDIQIVTTNLETIDWSTGPYDVSIPAGTRLSARLQSTNNNAVDRLLDVVIYGGG